MKLKATVSYHLTIVRMAVIKQEKAPNADRVVEEKEPLSISAAIMEKRMELHQKTKNRSTV